MTDVIDHLYRKAVLVQAQQAAPKLLWMNRLEVLSKAGITAKPVDLLGDEWLYCGWKETCNGLIRVVGQLSSDIAELQKGRP